MHSRTTALKAKFKMWKKKCNNEQNKLYNAENTSTSLDNKFGSSFFLFSDRMNGATKSADNINNRF